MEFSLIFKGYEGEREKRSSPKIPLKRSKIYKENWDSKYND